MDDVSLDALVLNDIFQPHWDPYPTEDDFSLPSRSCHAQISLWTVATLAGGALWMAMRPAYG
jgi:hypothetical protein